jgi:hypothetical protein
MRGKERGMNVKVDIYDIFSQRHLRLVNTNWYEMYRNLFSMLRREFNEIFKG